MSAEKGVAMLSDIREQLPEPSRSRVRLVLLGGASKSAQTVCGFTAFCAGFVEEIHDAMAGLDILLHPSSAEGLGTAVIDAVALGIPPVAFRVGGLPEAIEDQRSGLLAPAGDAAAFAAAIDRLIRDEDLRRRIGAAGPARAAEFSVERMFRGPQAVYDSVLTPASAPKRRAI